MTPRAVAAFLASCTAVQVAGLLVLLWLRRADRRSRCCVVCGAAS